ncbi:unnamed protein product [Leptidea sinapis]|uniref:Serendipity locus protein alpha n=1 Tax=Leptidea sinapis TaxID=189913 RepID=A0A5E4Q472_9NEOP|nr:unnamed protein product [Leptidea sinapis]
MDKDEKKQSEIMVYPSTKDIVRQIKEMVFKKNRPALVRISNTLHSSEIVEDPRNNIDKIYNIFNLCCDQIRKSIIILFEILDNLKVGCCKIPSDKESLQSVSERLSCCYQKLLSTEEMIDHIVLNPAGIDDSEDTVMEETMYFVNWIDQTFELLNSLSTVIYSGSKLSEELYNIFKIDLIKHVTGIHTCIDELLLSALTLCKYCLPADQRVVLRETKTLFGELIIGDLDSVFQATNETLRLPLLPSNVNVLIDVLKDVLYVLETNTNTALLALVLHCFTNNISPVDLLKEHFSKKENGLCPCGESENCEFVKEFDMYNERLMQIGSFAISCSSDAQKALDPHLVPAIMVSPHSFHSTLLIDVWKREVQDIRDNVFLIVDPAAFTQVCQSIQTECKIVSNILASDNDFVYPTKEPSQQCATFEQLLKRLKLLYTITNRINTLLSPNDTDEQFLEEQSVIKCETYTVDDIKTCSVKSPKKTMNLTRSIFARTVNIRSSTAKFPLAMLTKNLKVRKDLSFSIKLDELCANNVSGIVKRNASILYNTPNKNRASLRKAVLNRHCFKSLEVENHENCQKDDGNLSDETVSDELISLQITDVLNEINNLTATRKPGQLNVTYGVNTKFSSSRSRNGVNLSRVENVPVNNETITKCVLNSTLNSDMNANSDMSNVTQPSNIDSIERIIDINTVTSKISDLRCIEFETSL